VFRVQGLGCRGWGLGEGGWGLGLQIWVSGSGIQDVGFKV